MATHLEPLPEVERLSPACIRIMGGNPSKFTLQGTNTYLLGTGRSRLLIDTGEGKPSWIAAVRRTLEEERAEVASALITHWHRDHVDGIPQLLELSPHTKIYKHEASAGQQEIADGQLFEVEGVVLMAVHTPGHTTDHLVFVFQQEDALLTGDAVLGAGTAVFEDLGAYMDSLEHMRHLFRGRAYPAHGPVIEDGPAKILEYIRHRQQREEQVVQALRSPNGATGAADGDEKRAWSSMDLVKAIYADVPESLHAAAEGSVRQVLQKLEGERKVSRTAGRWSLTTSPAL
jgi:ribonuclease/clavin/mitogillin